MSSESLQASSRLEGALMINVSVNNAAGVYSSDGVFYIATIRRLRK